jgi:hypothetical protein
MVERQRNTSWLNRKDGPARCRQQTEFRLSVFWVGYRRVLDTQREARGTRCIKKQKTETAVGRKERFLGAGSEYTLCHKTEQRGLEDKSRKRIRHSGAQCKNNQSVLGIVPGLNRTIPVVNHFDERTNKAGQQNKSNCYPRRPGSHDVQYSASGSHDVKRSPNRRCCELQDACKDSRVSKIIETRVLSKISALLSGIACLNFLAAQKQTSTILWCLSGGADAGRR